MLIFPTAPTFGQEFIAADGAAWRWDGHKWVSRVYPPTASGVSVTAVPGWAPGNVQAALAELDQLQ